MAEVEIAPLGDRLGDDEVRDLLARLKEHGAPALPRGDESASKTVADGVDEDLVSEFLDRLEAFDVACDIYVPIEFDGTVEAGDYRVGSLQSLLDALDEMKDDLDAEDADEDDADDDRSFDLIRRQTRQLWKILYMGARAAMERKLPLHVRV